MLFNKKIGKLLRCTSYILFLIDFIFMDTISTYAKSKLNVKKDIKSIKNGSAMKKDAFKKATNTVYNIGGSGVTLLTTIFVVLSIISLIICGIGWMVHKNSQKYQENKDWLVRIALGCGVCFGAGAIVTLFYSIASNIQIN